MTPRLALFPLPSHAGPAGPADTCTPELGRFTAPGSVSRFCPFALPVTPGVVWDVSDGVYAPVGLAVAGSTPVGWHGQPSLLDALGDTLGLPPSP